MTVRFIRVIRAINGHRVLYKKKKWAGLSQLKQICITRHLNLTCHAPDHRGSQPVGGEQEGLVHGDAPQPLRHAQVQGANGDDGVDAGHSSRLAVVPLERRSHLPAPVRGAAEQARLGCDPRRRDEESAGFSREGARHQSDGRPHTRAPARHHLDAHRASLDEPRPRDLREGLRGAEGSVASRWCD